eukprot:TRINITY_DN6611_c0_g1_i1.p1 TRINITY_DN6611_c0_g1~~TRINITY_DN6611_c0_g1_i1.p1  ORF type:complete len:110 (-),score=57.10 TRINITY_DN6611_c0_g1_i1:75-404(-)
MATQSNIDEMTQNNFDISFAPVNNMVGQIQESEEPLLVNAKQYNRILKRRAAREKLAAKAPKKKNTYIHESRHKHAKSRKRAATGRFLKKEEINALENKEIEETQEKTQ